VKVVGIGGGHGLAVTLEAALGYADDVTAVVTVADDGGSSGRLTRELGIPPPGDIRNCLVAMAENEDMAELYQHRFESGELTGHAAGNLIIAALTEMTGDFNAAVAEAGRQLGARGRVLPATTDLVDLMARIAGGVVRGQVAVAESAAPIQAVYLEPPNPKANEAAVDAIAEADQIVLGPGSLFTSLIATLMVPGIRGAVQQTSAQRVFVCNTRRQKGETEDLDAASLIEAVLAHAGPFSVDAALVQHPQLPHDGVPVDDRALAHTGVEIVKADVAQPDGGHDPIRLGRVLGRMAEGARSGPR
jgi:uncharacterized cofD-like protein